MESFNNDKEIKKANLQIGIFKELTDALFISSATMTTLCIGLGIAKALIGKSNLPLGSLIVTNLTGSISTFLMAGMTNILKDDALDERNRLLKNAVAHHKNPNVFGAKTKQRK